MIYSLEFEKNTLAALIQYPECYADIAYLIKAEDFSSHNQTIFQVILSLINNKQIVDKVILSEKIKGLGIILPDIDVYSYIESLALIQINENAILEIAKELKKVTIRRNIANGALDLANFAKKSQNKTFAELAEESDKIYAKIEKVSTIEVESARNIFDDIDDYLETERPIFDEMKCPYECFQRYYGGFRGGNIYTIASRSGSGKSTILADIAMKVANAPDSGVKVLYLDTEMTTNEVKPRILAALSNVNPHFIETHKFKNNPEMLARIQKAQKDIKQNKYNFYHEYIASMGLKELISFIRKWYYKECGSEYKPLIVYDYLKILNQDRSLALKEYELMGDKVTSLKDAMTLLNAPLLTAVQVNRSGIMTNRDESEILDDESVISIADRIMWFCSFLAIFRRKSNKELTNEPNHGTHKMTVLKTRYQGEESMGHSDWVKILRPGEKKAIFKMNYLNFNVENFQVKEMGSLRDSVEKDAKIQYDEHYRNAEDEILLEDNEQH